MKNPSEIAKELRAAGRKFGQTTLLNLLEENCTPVIKHGRVVLYDDNATEVLLAILPQRLMQVTAPVEKQNTSKSVDLLSIRRMLEAICSELNITVAA